MNLDDAKEWLLPNGKVHSTPYMISIYSTIGGTLNCRGAKWVELLGARAIISREELATPGYRVGGYIYVNDTGSTVEAKIDNTKTVDLEVERQAQEWAAANAQAAARQSKIDFFQVRDIELMEFALRLRNFNIPAQYHVTLADAKEIWRKIVDNEV